MKKIIITLVVLCTLTGAFAQKSDEQKHLAEQLNQKYLYAYTTYTETSLQIMARQTDNEDLKEVLKTIVKLTIMTSNGRSNNKQIDSYKSDIKSKNHLIQIKNEITTDRTTNVHIFKTKEGDIKEIYYVSYDKEKYFELVYLVGKINIDKIGALTNFFPNNVLSAINPKLKNYSKISPEISNMISYLGPQNPNKDYQCIVDGVIYNGNIADIKVEDIDSLEVNHKKKDMAKYCSNLPLMIITTKKNKK